MKRPARYWSAGAMGLGLASLLATAALAQLTGSRISPDAGTGRNATTKDGVTAIRMIAECYYDRSSKTVGPLLNVLPGTAEEHAMFSRDADKLSPCLNSATINFTNKQVSFPASALRRPLAAEMARRVLLNADAPPPPAADTKPWFVESLAKMPADARVDRLALAVQDFGHCVAIARWNDSLALIKSADGSPEEQAAVAALIPVLGQCLTSGSTITITKRNLREMIGEPVYHLVMLAKPVGAQP